MAGGSSRGWKPLAIDLRPVGAGDGRRCGVEFGLGDSRQSRGWKPLAIDLRPVGAGDGRGGRFSSPGAGSPWLLTCAPLGREMGGAWAKGWAAVWRCWALVFQSRGWKPLAIDLRPVGAGDGRRCGVDSAGVSRGSKPLAIYLRPLGRYGCGVADRPRNQAGLTRVCFGRTSNSDRDR